MKSTQTKSAVVIAAAVAAAAAIMTATITVGLGYSPTNSNSNNENHQVNASTMTTMATTNSSATPENRTFWIDTVHLDGNANIHGDTKHPPEPFPANATYPKGAGFVLTPPDKSGAWNFRSFTFSTSQIVVFQGDKVTLNFVGVQGPYHFIEVQGIATFPLTRGQIHTVTFTADKVGTITYTCHVHMPNMQGEILVLPRPAATAK